MDAWAPCIQNNDMLRQMSCFKNYGQAVDWMKPVLQNLTAACLDFKALLKCNWQMAFRCHCKPVETNFGRFSDVYIYTYI